jgi:hypothetical protein
LIRRPLVQRFVASTRVRGSPGEPGIALVDASSWVEALDASQPPDGSVPRAAIGDGAGGAYISASAVPAELKFDAGRAICAAMTLFEEFCAVARALDADGVDYAVVGALAVGIWGAPRATQDIDLLVLPGEIERAKHAARTCGFALEALPLKFKDSNIELYRVSKIVNGRPLMVDFLLVNEGIAAIWHSRQRRDTDVGVISVVSRESLIAMKLVAGRPQDLVDVAKLTEAEHG